jgi:hypothetical protein
MSDSDTMLALLNALTSKVDGLSRDVAVLNDRRSDNATQDERHAALQTRVGMLERDLIARDARAKVVLAIISAASAIGGAGLIKVLALAGV